VYFVRRNSGIVTYMKKFFTIFFVTLGVIFVLVIIAGTFFFIIDPLNLKPLFFGNSTQKTINTQGTSDTNVDTATQPNAGQADKNTALSDAQEKALETFGIDPANVPTSITPEQETCFTSILGAERVAQIKAGDSPTATEYFKAKSCM